MFVDPAPPDDPYDFNRDRRVNASDQIIARHHASAVAGQVQLITAPPIDRTVPLAALAPAVGEPPVGDVNGDGGFDRLDLLAVLHAGKYLTGQQAAWHEGDWNADGLFDQQDLVLALQVASVEPSYEPAVSAHALPAAKRQVSWSLADLLFAQLSQPTGN